MRKFPVIFAGLVLISTGAAGADPSPSHPAGNPRVKVKTAAKGEIGLLPQTPHSGQLREGAHMNLELVKQTGQIYLYAQSKMGESVPSHKLEMTATIRPLQAEPQIQPSLKEDRNPPPTKTGETNSSSATSLPEAKIDLQPETDRFKALIDLKVPYILKVEAKPQGVKTAPDIFEFTVEP